MEIEPGLFQENERLAPSGGTLRFVDVGPLDCESGGHLGGVRVAYETWGTLSSGADNAVLICHALSGDSHAIGWWDRLVGEGKPIDTDRFYVIGTNCLGGCQGTTGPSSIGPDGRPYGSRFPSITVGDMVEVQRRALLKIGVRRLACVAGGSMGAMQALEWSLRFPGSVERAWITAGTAAHSAMQIGFNETARQAVRRDPKWRGGDYPLDDPPTNGLAVARMLGHLTYLSEAAFEAKFGRRMQEDASEPQFQVESYLNYQGDKFTRRFDANSLIVLTAAIDRFERTSFQGSRSRYLFTSFTSDWIYPSHQSARMHEMALEAGCASQWVDIDLPYGHDAFLLDGERQGELVRSFLRS